MTKETEKNFTSISFGEELIEVYQLHEAFKGIGFIVKYETELDSSLVGQFVNSVYSSKRGSMFIKYKDLKFQEDFTGNNECLKTLNNNDEDVRDPNVAANYKIDCYLKFFFISKTKNKAFAKYYYPTVVSIINSSDFSAIDFNLEDGWLGVGCRSYLKN